MHRRRRLTAILILALVAFAACTDDDQSSGDTPATTAGGSAGPGAEGGVGVIELVSLDDDSSYVQALCSIDMFHPADEDDPMGWLVAEMEALPTDSRSEAAEVEWLIERIEASQELEDSTETDDLSSVAAVLRARCA